MSTHRSKLVALSAALWLNACAEAEANVEAPPPPEVMVAEVFSKPLHEWEEFTGRLEAVENIEVRPRVAGYISAVHFEDGARVKRGQVLFELDPRPFEAELGRMRGELEQATAVMQLARLNDERGRRLLSSQVISREQADTLEADANRAEGALRAAAAALQAAQLNHEFTRVRAPIDGRVSRAFIRPGNLVSTESLLTTLVSEGPVLAYFESDERTYSRLAELQRTRSAPTERARVSLALPDEAGYPHEGRLDFLDNRVDPRTGMISMRARFDNRDGKLTPGSFVRLKLVLPQSFEAVLIDDRAVGTDLGRKFVLVLDAEGAVQYRAVTLGRQLDGLRVVKQGLVEGDVIVVNGHAHVRPGMRVVAKRLARIEPAASGRTQ